MKKKTNIRTVIRKMVREEVAMAIDEVINELKKPSLSSKPQNKIVEGNHLYKKYTENSVLNDVLNETAQTEEWKQMGDGTFDSSRMNEIFGKEYGTTPTTPDNPNGNLAASMGVHPQQDGMDFLKKDYRKLMQKVEEKKRGKV